MLHVVGVSPSMADAPTILGVNLLGAALVADTFFDLAFSGSVAVFIASLAAHTALEVPAEVLAELDDPLAPNLQGRLERTLQGALTAGSAYSLSKLGVIRLCRRHVIPWGSQRRPDPVSVARSDQQPAGRQWLCRSPREGAARRVDPAWPGRDDDRDRRRHRISRIRPGVFHQWNRSPG